MLKYFGIKLLNDLIPPTNWLWVLIRQQKLLNIILSRPRENAVTSILQTLRGRHFCAVKTIFCCLIKTHHSKVTPVFYTKIFSSLWNKIILPILWVLQPSLIMVSYIIKPTSIFFNLIWHGGNNISNYVWILIETCPWIKASLIFMLIFSTLSLLHWNFFLEDMHAIALNFYYQFALMLFVPQEQEVIKLITYSFLNIKSPLIGNL